VLRLLALHPVTGVSIEMITNVLWADRPPARAAAEAQGYVSRLRRLLGKGPSGGHGSLLTPTGLGYLLAGDIEVDVQVFSQLSRQADEAFYRGMAARACAMYERALGVWRGEPLCDIGQLGGHPNAVEIAHRRDEVIEAYADAAGLCGAYDRVRPHLRRLCTRQPLNERAHARLMLSLAASGQQAAALDVFEQIRRRLDSEIGLRPSAQLREVHIQILRQQVG